MKKKISNIFDEAKASEIETLVSQNEACDLSPDTLSAVKEKVYVKMGMGSVKKKKQINLRSRSFVAATACLCVIIVTCIVAWSIALNEKVTGENTYKYLVNPSESSVVAGSGFEIASDHGFYTSSENKVLEDVKKTVKSPFTSKTVEYLHSDCAKTENATEKLGDFYSIYDVYNSEEEELTYLHGTNTFCGYFYRENVFFEPNITLTKTEALNVAKAFLLKFLSEDQIAKFEAPTIEGPSQVFMYTISYVRKIAGFNTDETIKVFISFSGKVVGYNGDNLNKYDGYIDSITEKSVTAAKNALESKINSLGLKEASLGSPTITTNAYGELFLKRRVTYTNDEGFEVVNEYLINILS